MQYVVQPGDTLFSIAQRFGTTVQAILQANNITDPNLITVGQVLTIPVSPAPPGPTPSPTPTPTPVNCPTLRRGDRGQLVSILQTQLERAGFAVGAIDGIFGARTESAVRAFQQQRNLPVTGVVDVATWTALGVNCSIAPPGPTPPPSPGPTPPMEQFHCPTLRIGSSGPAVRLLQRLLQEKGFYRGPIDGIFGTRTQQSVRQFQRSQGIPVTGIADHATWHALGVECHEEPAPPSGAPIATGVGRGIRHILFANKRVYSRGETVQISLIKTNVTNDEITLRYRTSQIVEVTVRSATGNVVWRLSYNRQFAQSQRVITIFPGGTQVTRESWDQRNNAGNRVLPGTYTITVENLATNVSLSIQIEIR